MYSFEQLKVFVTVCESGSFSAALTQAETRSVWCQPILIANLEIAIDQELFKSAENIPVLTNHFR